MSVQYLPTPPSSVAISGNSDVSTINFDGDEEAESSEEPDGMMTDDRGTISDAMSSISTYSSFSLHSSMEHADFRQDGGRRFQASNDDYSLPADEMEFARLDRQHFGLKALNLDKNYLAPMAEALSYSEPHRRKRALDIGSGTGIWAIEMANEFPHVDWTGTDLFPIEPSLEVPDNLQFVQQDAVVGIDYPDNHFDLVHLRLLIAGVRDWAKLVEEVVRVTRPGGLVVFVDGHLPGTIHNQTPEETLVQAPGFYRFFDVLKAAFIERGYDVQAGSRTINSLLRAHDLVRDVQQVKTAFPSSAWSSEPNMIKSGLIMKENVLGIPDGAMMLIIDTMEITEHEFEQLKDGYVWDVERGCHLSIPIYHNWAWKR